jgi:hypothetical protein
MDARLFRNGTLYSDDEVKAKNRNYHDSKRQSGYRSIPFTLENKNKMIAGFGKLSN